MTGLSSMLDGLSAWIGYQLELKQEMDWDARE